jgi:hypothetical protein
MRNLLLLLLLLPVFAGAQITITQNDMPEPGDTLRYSETGAQQLDVNQTGANQFWDYSNMQPFAQDRDDYVYALATVYAFYFFGVNQYGTKVADTIGGGPFEFTDVYNFYKSTSNYFQAEGVGFRYQGTPLAAYYSDEDELFQFPMNYLDRDSSTYKFKVDLGTGLSFSQQGYRINEVDGWGVIKTPYDSVACLRLVSTTIGVDSMEFNGFQFAFPNQQRTIKFLANGVHIPVLEISGQYQSGFFQPQRARYRDQYQNLVAVAEPHESGIRFFPNPAANLLRIEHVGNTALHMVVMDAQGRVVESTGIGTPYVHSVEGYKAGVYLLRLKDEEGRVLETAKLFVAH